MNEYKVKSGIYFRINRKRHSRHDYVYGKIVSPCNTITIQILDLFSSNKSNAILFEFVVDRSRLPLASCNSSNGIWGFLSSRDLSSSSSVTNYQSSEKRRRAFEKSMSQAVLRSTMLAGLRLVLFRFYRAPLREYGFAYTSNGCYCNCLAIPRFSFDFSSYAFYWKHWSIVPR